jgi:hypothetical protein
MDNILYMFTEYDENGKRNGRFEIDPDPVKIAERASMLPLDEGHTIKFWKCEEIEIRGKKQ